MNAIDYNAIDTRADELIAQRNPTLPLTQVWSLLMSEFPTVHSNTIAERVSAAFLDSTLPDAGRSE